MKIEGILQYDIEMYLIYYGLYCISKICNELAFYLGSGDNFRRWVLFL